MTAAGIRELMRLLAGNSPAGVAGVLIAAATALALCRNARCAGGFIPQQVVDTSEQDYYANAYALIDLSPKDLLSALPELQGLEPAADQQQLPRMLGALGKSVDQSFQKFTRIVAKEQITNEQCDPGGRVESTKHYAFNYLILSRYESGIERVDEYRVDAQGKPFLGVEGGIPFSAGFASLWGLFAIGNQSGSRFRYLGVQKSGGQSTLVIGFAQKPGWATIVGQVNIKGEAVLLMYQGVAWIDPATYRILKLRVDLLKPRLDVKLERQTTEIRFGAVRLSDAASTALWVPLQVTVSTVWNGQLFRDQHLYSNYQLPASTTKIIGDGPDSTRTPKPN